MRRAHRRARGPDRGPETAAESPSHKALVSAEPPSRVAGCTQMKALCAPPVPRLNEVHVDKKVDLPSCESRLRDSSRLGQPLHRLSVHNRDDTSKRYTFLMGEMQRFGLEKLQISIGWVQAFRQPEPPSVRSIHASPNPRRRIRVAGITAAAEVIKSPWVGLQFLSFPL